MIFIVKFYLNWCPWKKILIQSHDLWVYLTPLRWKRIETRSPTDIWSCKPNQRCILLCFILNVIEFRNFYWILFKKKCGSYASIGHRRVFPDQESMALFFALLNSINKNRRKKKLGIIDLRSIVVHFHWSRV